VSNTPIPSSFKGQPLERGVENGVEWFTYTAPLFGAVNGYAHLPEGHPWRDLDLQLDDWDKGPKIHGGVTYGPTAEGWVGFDTLHAGDYWPGAPRHFGDDREWTSEQVADEARSLARQIAQAAS
jgi:hypothetical protein